MDLGKSDPRGGWGADGVLGANPLRTGVAEDPRSGLTGFFFTIGPINGNVFRGARINIYFHFWRIYEKIRFVSLYCGACACPGRV
ncbi:hypothetical protein Holit_01871 [Hollandina sp. SP2]